MRTKGEFTMRWKDVVILCLMPKNGQCNFALNIQYMANSNFLDNCATLLRAAKVVDRQNTSVQIDPTLDGPASGRLRSKGFQNLDLEWAKVTDASEYLVAVRKQGASALEKLLHSPTNTLDIVGLLPNQAYEIDVYAVRTADASPILLTNRPLNLTLETDFIINGDYPPPALGVPCPFGDCQNPVQTSGNCFDWASGTAFYRIEIVQNSSSEVVARNYLKKSVNGDGRLKIEYATGTSPCSGDDIDPILNGATLEGCEVPNAARICGTFPRDGRNLGYSLVYSPTGCCLDMHGTLYDNEYFLRVNLCQVSSGGGDIR